jgi:MFS family permease
MQARPRVSLGPALASLFSRGYFILMLVVHGLLNLSGWAVIGWAPVYLQEHFHLSQGAAGFAATGYSNGGAVVGLFIGGLWADRWFRRNGRARMFVPAVGMLICIPGIALFANTDVFAIAMLGLVVLSLAGAFYDPNTMPVLCEVVDPRYRATGYGLLNLSGMVAGGFGIYLSGVMRDWHLDLHLVFDFGAVLCLICAMIYASINPRRLPRRALPEAAASGLS